MGLFDDVKILENGEIVLNKWIEWDHFGIPNKPKWLREILRSTFAIFGHCLNCTVLDGCYFLERNMPKQPLHENCDCKKKVIAFSTVQKNATSECALSKFTDYVFAKKGKENGKQELFKSLGYTKEDSIKLQKAYEQQALQAYLNGQYVLKSLDRNGQRLSIKTNLNNYVFYSGWILEPEGKLRNTTPFGGKIK